MAKRFMDNSIFEKQWFRELPVRLKIVWFYLINKCDHAGILNDLDVGLLSYQIGDNYTIDEILEAFKGNIEQIGESKFYLSKFCKFQYGELNPNVKVHQSVIKILEDNDIDVNVSETNNTKALSVEDKKIEFAKRVEKEVLDMHLDPSLVKDFIEYWTEHNDNGKVLRYEQQSIFNIRKRMTTWKKNALKFNQASKFQSVSDEDIAKREARIEADYKAQQQRFKDAEKNVADEKDRRKALGLE